MATVSVPRSATLLGPRPVALQLVGSDGNAFAILGRFQRAARRQGWTPEQIKATTTAATSGDYNHLLAVILANTTEEEGTE